MISPLTLNGTTAMLHAHPPASVPALWGATLTWAAIAMAGVDTQCITCVQVMDQAALAWNARGWKSDPDSRGLPQAAPEATEAVGACDSACQTVLHPRDCNLDREYHWSEWELKRRALELANLRGRATHSAQTEEAAGRRDGQTQARAGHVGDNWPIYVARQHTPHRRRWLRVAATAIRRRAPVMLIPNITLKTLSYPQIRKVGPPTHLLLLDGGFIDDMGGMGAISSCMHEVWRGAACDRLASRGYCRECAHVWLLQGAEMQMGS